MILIVSELDDPHADAVESKLAHRGHPFVRYNPARFPSESSISLRYTPAGLLRSTLRVDGREIALEQLAAVWYRRPDPPVAHAEIVDPLTREFIEEESRTVVRDVWDTLTCLALPGPRPVVQRAQLRSAQLRVAGALGFELPPTLMTNDPAELLAFYREHDGAVITKAAGLSSIRGADVGFSRYTEPITRRDIGYAHSIRYCPMIVQAYVAKRVELRITVVGDEVFAAEIHSQESHHTRYDWRRYDVYKTPYYRHDLPAELALRCIELTRALGLRYGAIDMVLTPDGRYVFLEINPSGQYLWVEQATGLPISDAIADLLAAGSSAVDAPANVAVSAQELR